MKWVTEPLGLGGVLEGLTFAQLLAILSCPVWFLKNVINAVQLWKASKILVGVDLAEREKARREETERR
jgi:CDP-diacylglycerol--inositol 3-phosphatidyltransferase